MRKLDKLSAKYPPEKREQDAIICENYLMERDNAVRHFAEEHNEADAPMKWVEMEKKIVKPSRAGMVALLRVEQREWRNS